MPFQPSERILHLAPYVPGLSIAEIRHRYGLDEVIKLASNENPLGASPLVQEAIGRHAAEAFRYPQGGNPKLCKALAQCHGVPENRIIIGNGSDELIDMLMRLSANSGEHNIITCEPCFGIYPTQAQVNGLERRSVPLNPDFSPDFPEMLARADANTRLVFITAPDNPSGYCPSAASLRQLAASLAAKAPDALLVIDEAYMDFHPAGPEASVAHCPPGNVVILRTFSKSYGLAGMRIGYAMVPEAVADAFWRARLPFSVNILAEAAALAALEDEAFREATMAAVRQGRQRLSTGLSALGCHVWPSAANFLMFRLPPGFAAAECHEFLLRKGIIIRGLKSYGLPENLRVTVGNGRENELFLKAMGEFLGQ